MMVPRSCRLFLWLCLLMVAAAPALCQEEKTTPPDTVTSQPLRTGPGQPEASSAPDTTIIETVAKSHIPRKAALLSAALPGLGQVYNKKYWKLPIIYGGFATLGYLVIRYDDQYRLFRRAYVAIRNGLQESEENPFSGLTGNFTEQSMENAVDGARRYRELNMILIAGLFGLQIMDAIVDAHLIEFDVNENLALDLHPSSGGSAAFTQIPAIPVYGLALTLKIK